MLASARSAGLIALVTAFFFLLGDLAVGGVNRLLSDGRSVSCLEADPQLHHHFRANCETVEVWGHRKYLVATNSLGNRDATVRAIPPTRGNARRVVLIGDSYVVCCLPWDELIVGQLQRLAPALEFHTAGVISWSPTLYARRVRQLIAAGFEFDDLLVLIDISDIQDEAAIYAIDAAGGVYDMQARTREEFTGQPHDPLHLLLQRLAGSQKLRAFLPITTTIATYFAYREPSPGEILSLDRAAWTYNGFDPEVERRAYSPLGYRGGIAKAEAAMSELATDLRTRHIRLHVVVYPWPQQIRYDRVDSLQARIWRDWCARESCASFIDMFPAMFDLAARTPAWYAEYFIDGDAHYNARGNEVIARAILDRIGSGAAGRADTP